MSIIHDALKKVQQTSNAGISTSTPPAQEPAQLSKKNSAPDRTSILLFVATTCAIVAIIFAALPQFAPKKPIIIPALVTDANTPSHREAKQPPDINAKNTPSTAGTSSLTVTNDVNAPATPTAPSPTQKIADPNDPLSSIKIEGVLDMGGKKAVLINGNVYEEGQTIHDRIISEITFDTLTILDEGRKRTFPIKP